MRLRRILVPTALLAAIGTLTAQEKKDLPPLAVVDLKRNSPVVYEKEIEPIFVNKCLTCHSGNVVEGKLDMGTYQSLMKGGRRGVSIVPGKSAESLLVQMCARLKKPFMPPKSEDPLTPEELALIKLWVDQGAKPPQGAREKPKVVLSAPPATVKPIRSVAITADKKLVAASRGNSIHLYEPTKGDHVKELVDPGVKAPDNKPMTAAHLSLVESLAFSPDGKLLASGSYQEVTLWDVEKAAVKQKLTGFADRVTALAFSPDGKLLATGGGAPTEDGEIKVFDVATGKPAFEIKNGHSDTVFGVAFNPDGKLLATCGADKFVKVWEVPGGKFVKSFEGHTHHVLDVGWTGDGKFLASAGADNDVKVWDFEKGEQARTMKGHTKQVTRVAFIGAKAEVLTCSGDATARVWNVTNGGTIRQFPNTNDFLYAAAVSADGTVVALGGEEGVVRLYNGANAALIKELLPPGVAPKEAPKEPAKK